ncbi:hypothetical protein FRC00_006732 [Tulasnella sp. 408]|nr:hypothetical protein FRC00_006732 [Tulasnella sp. 408]
MFIIMGRIINLVGAEYSRLKPRTYSILFISADLLALIIQAIGGAAAASADTHDGAEGGAKIMLAGIFVQMAAITIYCIIQGDYLWHVLTERPVRPRPAPSGAVTPGSDMEDSSQNLILGRQVATGRARLTPNIKSMLLGLGIATVFIYIRSIYRTIELLGGWNGEIFVNERLFNLLDGIPIFVAMFVLNVFHPGRFIAIGNERNGVPYIELSKMTGAA